MASASHEGDDSCVEFTWRHATAADADRLCSVMNAAIGELQKDFLLADQVESSRRSWALTASSLRTARISSSSTTGRSPGAVAGAGAQRCMGATPRQDATPVFWTRPAKRPEYVRCTPIRLLPDGAFGRLILTLCEQAAASEGFTQLELMGTMSGQKLYEACGFSVVEEVEDSRGGAAVPLVKMVKSVGLTSG